MKLRMAVSITIVWVLAATLGVVISVVSVVLDRAARQNLGHDLARDHLAFADMLRYRTSLHRADSRVLADEPRLKAVVSTDDVTAATVAGVLADLRRALRSDLLLLTDPQGVLIADAAHPNEQGDSLANNATVATALQHGAAEDIWVHEGQILQVHARRLSFGLLVVGAVLVGYRLDDALADLVGRHIGAGIVLLLDGRIIASSALPGAVQPSREQLTQALGRSGQWAAQSAQELQLAGQHFLFQTAPLPGYQGTHRVQVVLLRSLDRAVAAARSLLRWLLAISALALAASVLAAVRLSHRLSRPIDQLATFAQRIAGGDLRETTAAGLYEVKTLGAAMNAMVRELSASRAQIAEKTRMAKELEIAERIQTSILPRDIRVGGLSLTAQMLPASEVGGDYYDVIPQPDGCWIGIGDVAGHGLPAGLVMLMVQSAFATLVRSLPEAPPHKLVSAINHVVYDNVRNRLRSDEHVTFTALRYFSDGRLQFAGAHEPLLILRQATGRCELVPTPGTWLGVIPEISQVTSDSTVQLQPGDVVLLYSDGLIEAMSDSKQQLGMSRVQEEVERCSGKTAAEMHAHLLQVVRDWSPHPDDDITLLVLRYEGTARGKEST